MKLTALHEARMLGIADVRADVALRADSEVVSHFDAESASKPQQDLLLTYYAKGRAIAEGHPSAEVTITTRVGA